MQDTFKNYQKETRIINLYTANLFGLLFFIPVIFLYGGPFYLIWGKQDYIAQMKGHFEGQEIGFGFTVVLVAVLGILLHEFIHGLSWASFTKRGFKSIKFGVLWKMLTPYCHCKEPLSTKQYIIGAAMPALVLGIIPGLLSILTGSFPLLVFAIFFTAAAAGDFMLIAKMLKEDKDSLVMDHPSEAGYYVFIKEE